MVADSRAQLSDPLSEFRSGPWAAKDPFNCVCRNIRNNEEAAGLLESPGGGLGVNGFVNKTQKERRSQGLSGNGRQAGATNQLPF